ncbi:MAG: flagellar type III secretion system pore protein FliP, partial [Verrucomicrobiota bacterium]
MKRLALIALLCGVGVLPLAGQDAGAAEAAEGFSLSVNMGEAAAGGDWSVAIQLILVMTLLSLAPMLLIMSTSFVRIVIVLGFARQAMGTQHAPPNQVLVGLALLLTAFIMQPVWERINADAIEPMRADEISTEEAWARGAVHMKEFMLSQTRTEDFDFIAAMQPDPLVDGEPKFTVVVAAFVLSELRTAFQMGILIYLPFI